ncbi:MAG TPA: hypothetical protein VH274_05675 [Mycobacteriales bacterium]|jgi:hypothetical protein|nr:hypothetical protein [Mycobacteriales bacterium]
MSRRLSGIAMVAAVLLASACTANAPGDLTTAAAKVLRPAVENVRQVAAAGSFTELRQAVQDLKDLVQQEERAGDVSAQRANAIEDAADVLLQDARPTPSPTPSSASPTPTETSESPSPTPTSASPTPSESASPTPSDSHSPIVSVSAVAGSPHGRTSPSASPSPSAR